MIFVNVRNKDLKTGYDINRKIIWGGYAQWNIVYNITCNFNLDYNN
jgi:hypothetical protein